MAFTSRNLGITQKDSVRIITNPAEEIRAEHLWNTSLQCFPWANLFGRGTILFCFFQIKTTPNKVQILAFRSSYITLSSCYIFCSHNNFGRNMNLAIFYLHRGKTIHSYLQDHYYHNHHYKLCSIRLNFLFLLPSATSRLVTRNSSSQWFPFIHSMSSTLTDYALWGYLGRGINPTQGRYLHRRKFKQNNGSGYVCIEWDSNQLSKTYFVP
jgi:hypothetical protein